MDIIIPENATDAAIELAYDQARNFEKSPMGIILANSILIKRIALSYHNQEPITPENIAQQNKNRGCEEVLNTIAKEGLGIVAAIEFEYAKRRSGKKGAAS